MASNKFTKARREANLAIVADMYLVGQTQAAIGKHIGVSAQQISEYLKTLQARWQIQAAEAIDARKGRELARLDRLEREYWEAWDRSCQNGQTNVNKARTTTVEAYTEAGLIEMPALEREWTRTERGQSGNPAYLNGIKDCIEMRLKIVGGFAPTKVEVYDWRTEAQQYGVDPEQTITTFEQALTTGDPHGTGHDPD